jgi:hypothetical protein
MGIGIKLYNQYCMKTAYKTFVVMAFIFAFTSVSAQTELPTQTNLKQEIQSSFKQTNLNQVIQTTDGYTFSKRQLINLPTRNVNRIANLVGGVQSYANEVPRIRGAEPHGTAYFVDGMRVYGALPTTGY